MKAFIQNFFVFFLFCFLSWLFLLCFLKLDLLFSLRSFFLCFIIFIFFWWSWTTWIFWWYFYLLFILDHWNHCLYILTCWCDFVHTTILLLWMQNILYLSSSWSFKIGPLRQLKRDISFEKLMLKSLLRVHTLFWVKSQKRNNKILSYFRNLWLNGKLIRHFDNFLLDLFTLLGIKGELSIEQTECDNAWRP